MNADYYIEKLRERVLANPGSKLILTLAEELKKRGEQEEALLVLKEGIAQNPAFAAARLTLGRWFLKDDKLDEARKEFSAVLEVSPGDKFALHYLKEIDAKMGGGEGAAGKRTIERLNRFQDAVRKRFASTSLDDLAAGDR
jgi:tetratricopeptide (TPR) repeat protein